MPNTPKIVNRPLIVCAENFCYTGQVAGELFKTRIEGIAAGGDGIARIGGKSVFIGDCIPGETVVCRITEEHSAWSKAEILEITESSNDRVLPACRFYGKCGGCNFQHINYEAQLALKISILKEAFIRIGGFIPPEPLVISSEPWEYRNRMQLHRIEQNYGLKTRKGSEIIPIDNCPIADPGIITFLQEVNKISPHQPQKDRFTVYARNGLFLSEIGINRGKIHVLDRDIILDVQVFFQSNGAMLEKMIVDLKEIASGINAENRNLPMADLYCGVGTFAAFVGDMFPRADLVEENKTALALARENLASSVSAEFFAQRIENWVIKAANRYGFIIADPPRKGLDPAAADWLAVKGPPLFAYVSCDPATLARDSKILLKGGYELKELRFYDFYPQTAHIESMAIFQKFCHIL